MREAEFRAWLEARGAKTQAGRNSRVYAVRTIEKNLASLGSRHVDLAAAYADDGFAKLRERIRQLRIGAKTGSDEYRILMPDSEKPLNRLSSWNSWLAQYGRFLGGETRATGIDRDALEELKTRFLAKFPDFESGGGFPGQSVYHPEEDDYKRALLAQCQPLRGALDESIAIGEQILDALMGHQSNLLGYYKTKQRLADIRAHHPGELEQAVGDLANSNDAPSIAAESFLESAWSLLSEGAENNLPYGESRILATAVQALTRPDLAISVIYQRFHNLGMTLIGRPLFGNNPLTAAEYEDVLDLAAMIFDVMAHEWNWQPRDLWDVQGFIWVTCADKLEGEETQADRIRAHVLNHYINPARARGDRSVTVVVGPLNNEMGLNMAWPNICQAIEGRKFQELANVPQPTAEGAKQSTTRKLTFTLSEGASAVTQASPQPINFILYGPPGTGKTYHTAREAVALCDGQADYPETREGRTELMARYNELVGQEQIGFVTFHQNYGYEDFVEGLRPTTYGEDGEPLTSGFRLAPEAGIFTKMAERAEALRSARDGGYDFAEKRFFKMSLGEVANPEDDYLFEEAIEGRFVHLGDDSGMDWSEPVFTTKELMIAGYTERHPDDAIPHPNNGIIEFPFRLRVRARVGDIIIVSKGNLFFRAIGEITGDYHQVKRENDDYTMRRSVKWLWIEREGVSHDVIYGKRFSQRTIYELTGSELKLNAIRGLIEAGQGGSDEGPAKQFVLIIDEINRANVSKVFGELITLLEPDKRTGMDNALSVTLPYSKRPFSVPANLHIIGTMNTADRSIALLDTALRRRFNFLEVAPEPGLLAEATKRTGIDLVAVLTTINRRIEYLIDREHRIGHAFFISCETAENVHAAMRDKVIPLLQEYFFEDWSRIAAVVGDGFIKEDKLDPPPGIEGDRLSSWSILSPFKDDAFLRLIGNVNAAAEVIPEAEPE